jgi:ArsR family transcriptional regulator, lead/cadmium/zinc/bismuth-responsive transcriptional repressor
MASTRCDAYKDDPTRVGRVAGLMPPQQELVAAAGLHQALGHPVRAAIVAALSIEPLCVCELSALLEMSSPALMHHLRILLAVGAIQMRKEGKFANYYPSSDRASAALRTALQVV